MEKRILIAYYSWSGNTAKIAEKIKAATGGDLFAIRPAAEYPSDYQKTVQQAKREITEGKLPAIAENMDLTAYDMIFIGTPNWWSTAAPPVSTFLNGKDFVGKTVMPFSTHGGGGVARTVSDMAALCRGGDVREGFSVYGAGSSGTEKDIAAWLKTNGL